LLKILPHVMEARERTVSQQMADNVPEAQEKHQKEQQRKAAAKQPNPPAPFPKREGGERPAAGIPGDGVSSGAGSPPSFLGKGAGGLGQPPLTNGFPTVDEGPWLPD